MNTPIFPENRSNMRIHLVGAKGAGVSALAEFLADARLSASDTEESFYSDAVLKSIGIEVRLFNEDNITSDIDLVIHSAAWNPETHPELKKAVSLGIPLLTYPQALGAYSRAHNSAGICGVHGKTTSSAFAGIIAKALGIPAGILAASSVRDFGNRSTLQLGEKYFIAETCEYRRHFLNFHPDRILLTSVESDHQDYYPDYRSILEAFVEYLDSLPSNGTIVYCADDPGAVEAVSLAKKGPRLIPYGFDAEGPYRILSCNLVDSQLTFRLAIDPDLEFRIGLSGKYLVQNATGALALCIDIAQAEGMKADRAMLERVGKELGAFSGLKRRSEIIGRAGGILFMDDYAHHPSAIRQSLSGLVDFYKPNRLIVSFMSHTYTRTAALFDEFAKAFSSADLIIYHDIYSSAREKPIDWLAGDALSKEIAKQGKRTIYYPKPMDALPYLLSELKKGDLFVSMGAGDNWQLSEAAFKSIAERESK